MKKEETAIVCEYDYDDECFLLGGWCPYSSQKQKECSCYEEKIEDEE